MGWVAGGRKANGGIVGYKEGGEVKEYGAGGEVDDFDPEAERKRIEAEKKALAKAKLASQSKQAADKKAADARYNSYQAKQKQLADQKAYSAELKKKQIELDALQNAYTTMKAQQEQNLNVKSPYSAYGVSNRSITSEQALQQQQELLDKIQAKQSELNDVKQKYDYSNNDANYGLAPQTNATTGKRGVNYFNPEQIDITTPVATTKPTVTNPAPKVNPYKAKPAISANTTPDVTFDPTAWANRDGEVTPPETIAADTTPLGQPKVYYTNIETPVSSWLYHHGIAY